MRTKMGVEEHATMNKIAASGSASAVQCSEVPGCAKAQEPHREAS